ncbi:MAG: hypothetical protein AAF360_07750, partial [Pseudomonadota bacterium]
GGGGDSVRLSGWYAEDVVAARRIDSFEADGLSLDQGSVNQLVDAMAAWSARNAASADRGAALGQDNDLQLALGAWQSSAGGP